MFDPNSGGCWEARGKGMLQTEEKELGHGRMVIGKGGALREFLVVKGPGEGGGLVWG